MYTDFVYTVVVYSDKTRVITLASKRDAESVRLTRAANGVLTRQEYMADGRLCRFNGPALTYWNTDDKLIFEEYRLDGALHNIGGPAIIRYFPDTGFPRAKWWYTYGRIHNGNDEPAIGFYNRNGSVRTLKWYTNGGMTQEETYSRERRRA